MTRRRMYIRTKHWTSAYTISDTLHSLFTWCYKKEKKQKENVTILSSYSLCRGSASCTNNTHNTRYRASDNTKLNHRNGHNNNTSLRPLSPPKNSNFNILPTSHPLCINRRSRSGWCRSSHDNQSYAWKRRS